MKRSIFYVLLLFLSFPYAGFAQPTFIGTMLPDGNYTTYNLNDLGAFRQVRLQATSSAGADTRIWEFATGNYFENWRPYTFPSTVGFDQIVDPAVQTASARYNSNFGGASSFFPPITASNFYTINITEFAPPSDQFMAVWETTYNPVAINTVVANPIGDPTVNNPVAITVTTSAAPDAAEQVFIRYTTDNFVTSNLLPLSFMGSTGTAQIPGLPLNTQVQYYVYNSSSSMANILAGVGSYGQLAHDMSTLNFNNNSGSNYSYTVLAPLPIELITFEASAQEKHIELHWETGFEKNNSHFNIEKSTDGKEWTSINQIAGSGNTIFTQKYVALDKSPFIGPNYYRLQQVDYDDNFSYSPTIFEVWKNKKSITTYPNPVNDQLFISDLKDEVRDLSIQIYNNIGQVVHQEIWNGHSVEVQHLAAGIYFVSFELNGSSYQQKIIIE